MTTTFQRCPETGCTVFVPGPSISTNGIGDHQYSFPVWLKRRAGRDEFLQTVTYTSSAPILLSSGEGTPALTSVVLPAMAMGADVEIEAPVSPLFLQNLETLQGIFAHWFPHYQKIDVRAEGMAVPPHARTDSAGAFFSAGVDGFYTLKHNFGELSSLIFVHGFDVDLERIGHRIMAEDLAAKIASDLRRELVVVQTNARAFSDRYSWWGDYCGWTLGACSQLLEGTVGRMLTASSNTYADYIPFGTTPLTDSMFSTEGVQIVHDGSGTSRVDKVFELAKWDYALEHLRVCWTMEEAKMNCCACDKCLRTMTSLWLAGALERAVTFGQPLIPDRIAGYDTHPAHEWFVHENYRRAEKLGLQNHPIMRTWVQALARSKSKGGPSTVDALTHEVATDPLRPAWLADHVTELVSDAGQHNPAALVRALRASSPGVLDNLMMNYAWKVPAAIAGRHARRIMKLALGKSGR